MKLVPTSISPVTITLYRGIPFDNNYEEHTLLSNKFKFKAYSDSTPTNIGNDKEAFINMIKDGSYVYPRTTKSGTYNFAFGNGLVTSVVMELTGNEINSNYMKVVASDGLGNSETYYYFITGIIQKNEVTYLLSLELDVLMTYTDEMLESLKDKEIMFERKHCRRILKNKVDGVIKTNVNNVCFNQESTFSQLKPKIVKNKKQLHFKGFIRSGVDYGEYLEELNWIYIIYEQSNSEDYDLLYRENEVVYPYKILCLPSKTIYFQFRGLNDIEVELNPLRMYNSIVGNSKIKKVIISPFPPFNKGANFQFNKDGSNRIIWSVWNATLPQPANTIDFHSNNGVTDSIFRVVFSDNNNTKIATELTIIQGCGGLYPYKDNTTYFNVSEQSIYTPIEQDNEYKLLIAPFRDIKMCSYYGSETSILSQLMFLKEYNQDWGKLNFYSVASTNAETNTYFNYCEISGYDLSIKRGISNSVSYNFPTGTNAETLYNQSSKSQYENSRVVGSITNGLKMVAGGLSIAFAPSVTAKVAGGVAIASGVAGEIDTFSSWSSKMKDLENAPVTYNISGSSLPYDLSLSYSDNNNNLLPYIIEMGVIPHEEDMARKFIYNYGYEYNLESVFSTDLTRESDNAFERGLFNYVKIRENITSKLVSNDLPLVVAQKISEVFNAGIKLWTFFSLDFTDPLTIDRVINNWFQKEKYCNSEVTQ